MNKPDFDTELRPLLYFVDNFKENGSSIESWNRPKCDPPDFFLEINDREINFEITTIVQPKIYELNNLFDEVDSFML